VHYYTRERQSVSARPAAWGATVVPHILERHLLYMLMLVRAALLRLECHAFKLFFVQHARNYCLGMLDYTGFVIIYTTLGQHLSYVF
jgi:hypothetical protein